MPLRKVLEEQMQWMSTPAGRRYDHELKMVRSLATLTRTASNRRPRGELGHARLLTKQQSAAARLSRRLGLCDLPHKMAVYLALVPKPHVGLRSPQRQRISS